LVSAQNNDEIAVKQTVDNFFEAFHAQDSIIMKKVVRSDIVLQTIGLDSEGKQRLKTENINDLINSIISIPDSINFQERLTDYTIQIDGAMANVWTPYEFWLDNEFHHCGVNSFQLFKDTNDWKIIYLIDTRRKEGCNQTAK
jgi:hypothetical protein